MTTLYLCYQSLLDPLTWSQVVAYLEGLARAGYRPIRVTFEPRLKAKEIEFWRDRLTGLGIRWRRLRYHKRPTVPATALDVACGVALGIWLIARHRVRLIHARSHVPAVMASVLSSLTGRPFLFDIRGFLAEEYADAGVWPAEGLLYRWTKRVERRTVGRAAGIVVLADRAAALLQEWYPRELADKPVEVIPCCVDRRSEAEVDVADQDRVTAEPGRERRLVYVGKLGGWYPSKSMVEFFAAARRSLPGLRWTVFTQSDDRDLRNHAARLGVDSLITIGRVRPDELLAALGGADAGLCLYRRDRSAPACSPTKIPEYLAAGLPVVASAGIGDVDGVLRGLGVPDDPTIDDRPVGILVDERDPLDLERAAIELKRLLDVPDIRSRCRAAAARGFDLEAVGWVRYRRIYDRLIGSDPR